MFRSVDGLLDSENLLGSWNFVRINEAVAMMRESGAQFRPRCERQPHAARPAVKIERKIRGPPGIADFVDIGIPLENRRESRLDDHRDLEIGPMALEQRERGRGQHAVAERPQTDHGDPRAGWQPIE